MREVAGSLLAIWAVLAVQAPRLAAAGRPAISAESAVFSQYVWRGMLATNGPVLQNSVTVLWRGAHVNLWTNQDLNSAHGRRGKFNEVDFDAGYDRSLEKASISAGVIRYTFPNTPMAATTELYAGASLAAPLRPAVKAFFDVDGVRGAYLTFDVSHRVALPKPAPSVSWAIELAAGAGWGSSGYSLNCFLVHRPGWLDVHPSVAVPVSFGKRWCLTPRLGYSALARGALRQSGVAAPHGFVAGLVLGFTR